VEEIRPIAKALSMRVPGFSSGAKTFDETLAHAVKTKETWEIMYVPRNFNVLH
jgi:hypothetical protein